MLGKDGWLFLDMDSNQVVKQHSGLAVLSDDDVERWQILLETRISRLRDSGARYLFVVAPDAHAVYPEMLPGDIEVAAKRPVLQLIDHLRAVQSEARYIYPLEPLARHKPRHAAFPKTGTHWNAVGAFLAYDVIVSELEPTIPLRRLTMDELIFEPWVSPSDLGRKVAPIQVSEVMGARMRDVPKARLLSDNCVENRGALIEFCCPSAPDASCLVFGDSSAYSLLVFLAESFRRLVFAHASNVDFELVTKERPSVVISLMTERFLLKVPSDSEEHSIFSVERSKRTQGRLRRPVPFTRILYQESLQTGMPNDETDRSPMIVGDLMVPARAARVAEGTTVRMAAERLAELQVNAISIVDGDNRYRGMLTTRAVTEMVARGGNPDVIRAEELVPDLLAVSAEDSVDDAAALMSHHKVRWLPVIDADGRLAGQIGRPQIAEHTSRLNASQA